MKFLPAGLGERPQRGYLFSGTSDGARFGRKTDRLCAAEEERCVNVPSEVDVEFLSRGKEPPICSPRVRPSTTLWSRSASVWSLRLTVWIRRSCFADHLRRSKRSSFIGCGSTCLFSIVSTPFLFRTRRST